MQSEAEFTATICDDLRRCNAVVLPIVGNAMMPRGWPDRYVHHAYWQGWLEFKAVNGIIAAAQREIMKSLNVRKSGSAFVVRQLAVHCATDGRAALQSEYGSTLLVFDGTGKELLRCLKQMLALF